MIKLVGVAAAAALLAAGGFGGSHGLKMQASPMSMTNAPAQSDALMKSGNLIQGATVDVSGRPVSTWAVVQPKGQILQVGVTIPLEIAQNPPSKPGKGPAFAVAVLPFPKEVQDKTYFNHFELQWNPHGHPPACYKVPHYDFHFYDIPPSQVMLVHPSDTIAPQADRIPAGYVYPGVKQCVPQMGVHASMPMDMSPKHPFRYCMIAGFYGGKMTFIEPMVTRAYLLTKRSFNLPVPQPKVFGKVTLYPHAFIGSYDPKARVYRLVFSDFSETAS